MNTGVVYDKDTPIDDKLVSDIPTETETKPIEKPKYKLIPNKPKESATLLPKESTSHYVSSKHDEKLSPRLSSEHKYHETKHSGKSSPSKRTDKSGSDRGDRRYTRHLDTGSKDVDYVPVTAASKYHKFNFRDKFTSNKDPTLYMM